MYVFHMQIQALKNMAMEVTRRERLEGLVPVPQEFHKRGIVGQVNMSIHYLNSDSALCQPNSNTDKIVLANIIINIILDEICD
jgi:hypothetical protein